eukprot:scaffold837_cov416-Prasinococcus_capsulatus_cf.AAC.9
MASQVRYGPEQDQGLGVAALVDARLAVPSHRTIVPTPSPTDSRETRCGTGTLRVWPLCVRSLQLSVDNPAHRTSVGSCSTRCRRPGMAVKLEAKALPYLALYVTVEQQSVH